MIDEAKRMVTCGIVTLTIVLILFGFQIAVMGATYFVDQHHPAAEDRNDGSESKPWKTIDRAARGAQAGDTILIQSGIYREKVTIAASGTAEKPIRFQAAPMADVVVTGADLLSRWQRENGTRNIFSTPWLHHFIDWSKTHAHPDDDFHRLIGRCEQVFVLGSPLRQVLKHDELAMGTFFADLEAKRLYIWTPNDRDPGKIPGTIEASSRDLLWDCKGDYVQTCGLHFRYAANPAQHGAGVFSGNHDEVEDCTFEQTNGVGASFTGTDIIVRRCTFQDNGQMGFGAARAHRLLLSECIICNNNVKGFDRNWEAGGDKIVLTRGAVIERCQFLRNRGHGIWFDIGNEQCEVRNCLIADNQDAGIFDEISFGLHAHDNVVVRNGLANTPGMWGASGGICLSSSPNSVIERNLLIANKEGLSFREARRTTGRIDSRKEDAEEPIWNHDEVIGHNVIAYNRDAQTWGWFDVPDERQWPADMQENRSGKTPLSLETLHLDLADNLYATLPGQELLHWGTTWKRNKSYKTLDDVRQELKLEKGSQALPFTFNSLVQRDFRVPSHSPAIDLKCYPKGTVPGARLGIIAQVQPAGEK